MTVPTRGLSCSTSPECAGGLLIASADARACCLVRLYKICSAGIGELPQPYTLEYAQDLGALPRKRKACHCSVISAEPATPFACAIPLRVALLRLLYKPGHKATQIARGRYNFLYFILEVAAPLDQRESYHRLWPLKRNWNSFAQQKDSKMRCQDGRE